MKRIIALLLSLSLIFSLVACGNKQNEQAKEPANSGTVEQAPDKTPEEKPADQAPEEKPAPSEPEEELNNEMVEYYMQKTNEVQVTDTHVIFTDDGSGKELTIEKNPQNVSVLYGSLTALWYEAGGTVPLAIGGKSAVLSMKYSVVAERPF